MVALGAGEPDEGRVADQLIAEFGERIDTSTIRLVAEQELALFDRAKVRTFVPIIAWRLARARLQEHIDDELCAAAGLTRRSPRLDPFDLSTRRATSSTAGRSARRMPRDRVSE